MPTMQELLDRDSEAWKPEPGESIVGTVVAISETQGDWDPYPVIEFDDLQGNALAWHAFHTVAKNEVESKNPQPGDQIGIKYYGKVPTKPGSKYSEYEKWRVQVIKGDATPDAPNWSEEKKAVAATTVDDDGVPF